MHKKGIVYIAVLTAIMVLSSAIMVYAQQSSQPIEIVHIAGGVYEIRGGSGANGGMYIGENTVMLIDAKMTEDSVDEVLGKIKEMTGNPITYVVNTHSDGDHVTGNRFYPASATFISHENCRVEMLLPGRNGQPSDWNDPALAPYLPALTFTDRMNIHIDEKTIELLYFGPGHTTGDLVVYFPEEKIAFIGDQLFIGRPQLIHAYKGGSARGHVANLINMLDTIDADTFLSGHNEPVGRQEIRDHITTMQAQQEKVRSLRAQGMSLEDIQSEFDDSEAALVEVIYNELND